MTASSSNTTNVNYIRLAANAELDRIVHFQLPAATPAENGWFGRIWTLERQISPLEAHYNALKAQEAALNTDANNQESDEVNTARETLIQTLDADATPETKAKLTVITTLFRIANEGAGEIDRSALSQLPASSSNDSDMLKTLNEHIEYLTHAREMLLQNDQTDLATTLLKWKISYIQLGLKELDHTSDETPEKLYLRFELEYSLDTLYPIIEEYDKTFRADKIIQTLANQFGAQGSPQYRRNLNAVAPDLTDVNAPFKQMMTPEQQFRLEKSFREECIRNLTAYVTEDETNLILTDLVQQKKILVEIYYQRCALLELEEKYYQGIASDKIHRSLVADNITGSITGSWTAVNLPVACSSTDPAQSISLDSERPLHQNELWESLLAVYATQGRINALRYASTVEGGVIEDSPEIAFGWKMLTPQEKCETELHMHDTEIDKLNELLLETEDNVKPKITQRLINLHERKIQLLIEFADNYSANDKTKYSQNTYLVDTITRLNSLRGTIQTGSINDGLDAWKNEGWYRVLTSHNHPSSSSQTTNDFEEIIKNKIDVLRRLVKMYESTKVKSEGQRKLINEIEAAKISLHTSVLQQIIDTIARISKEEEACSSQISKLEDQLKSLEGAQLFRRQRNITDKIYHTTLEITEHQTRRTKIQQQRAALLLGYESQIHLYRRLKRPENGILEVGKSELLNFLTLGLYGVEVYVSPEEFASRKNFAEAGYSLEQGIEICADWRNISNQEQLIITVKALVHEFIDWADAYPQEAARLASDIILALGILRDEALINELSNAINTKIYIASLLGTINREVEDPKIKKKHFKFRALADFAHHAPKVSAFIKALQKAGSKLIEGGFFEAAIAGVTTFAVDGWKGSAVQRIRDHIDDPTAQALKVVLDITRGASFQEVIAAQANIEIARLAGNARRAIFATPGAVAREALSYLAQPFRQIRYAVGGSAERFTRLAAMTITHIVTTGLVAKSKIDFKADSVNMLVLKSMSIIITGIFVSILYTRFINPLLNMVWPETATRIRRVDIEREIDSLHMEEIRNQAVSYIEDLRRLKVFPEIEREGSSGTDALTAGLRERFSALLDARIRARNANQDQLLNPQYYVRELLAIERKIHKAVVQSAEYRDLRPDERDEYLGRKRTQVQEALIADWLTTKIVETMRTNFINFYEADQTPEARIRELEELRHQALNTLTETVIDNRGLVGDKKGKVQEQLDGILRRPRT